MALDEASQQHPPVSPETATHIFNSAWATYGPANQPLSPEATEDLLMEQEDLGDTVCATAYGLVSTIHRRAQQYDRQLRAAEGRVLEQRELVAQRDERITQLQRQLGNVELPPSFEPNEGHVTCTIPSEDRLQVAPRFVRRLGNRRVEMVAEREAEESVYIAKLYLTPTYSRNTMEPTPPWFLQLLGGPSAGFNILAEATYAMDQWAVHAEVLRYQENDEERRMVEAEITELTARANTLQEHLDNCKHHLEAAGIPHLLRNLKGCADIPCAARNTACCSQRIRFNGHRVPF
jgi:hypothetical protein